jgi:hypothetical protein
MCDLLEYSLAFGGTGWPGERFRVSARLRGTNESQQGNADVHRLGHQVQTAEGVDGGDCPRSVGGDARFKLQLVQDTLRWHLEELALQPGWILN